MPYLSGFESDVIDDARHGGSGIQSGIFLHYSVHCLQR